MGAAIKIACQGAGLIDIADAKEMQGDLKSLSADAYAKLKKEILDTGFAFPLHLWKDPAGQQWIVGGHQRKRVLQTLRKEGLEIPPVPYVQVEADSMAQAKRRVLQDAAQYGEIQSQGLYEFMDSAGIGIDDLAGSFALPELDLDTFRAEFYDDPAGGSGPGPGEGQGENPYSAKIEAPVYETKDPVPPRVEELLDTSKADELSQQVRQADIPDEVKSFLLQAARRHVVFDYQAIAEFYAHASAEVQALMERSALVIIDFDQAIENGFARLSEKLAQQYAADYPEQQETEADASAS